MFNSPSTSKARKVDDTVKMFLLAAVEASGFDRKDVSLKELCGTNEFLFGEPASEKRRAIQFHWNNIRGRPIRSYKMLLDQHKVKPSATTLKQLEAARRVPSPESVPPSPSEPPIQDQNQEVGTKNDQSSAAEEERSIRMQEAGNEDDDDDYDDDLLAEEFGRTLSFVEGNDDEANSKMRTPTMPKRNSRIPPAQQSPGFYPLLPQMFSPGSNSVASGSTPLRNQNSTPGTGPSILSNGFSGTFLGSKDNPYPIEIDLSHPERAYPFEVYDVPRVLHNGWSRPCIHIRMEIGVGDVSSWSAWMDTSVAPPGKAIMIRGKSRSAGKEAIESFHRRHDPAVSEIKSVYVGAQADIASDPSRQAFYWRLFLPDGVTLDNAILSSDATRILKKGTGVTYSYKSKEYHSYFVHWMIAKANAGHQVEPDPSTAFDDDDEAFA